MSEINYVAYVKTILKLTLKALLNFLAITIPYIIQSVWNNIASYGNHGGPSCPMCKQFYEMYSVQLATKPTYIILVTWLLTLILIEQ